MKKIFLSIFVAASVLGTASAQNKIVIPDTKDYLVLTGDMHMHSIFSDGSVWPATRIRECVAEGVEVLCMTDHMDGRHQKMARQGLFNSDRNTSNEIAAKAAKGSGVILIRGGEISRDMAPGHFNTLFLSDVEPVAQAADAHKDHQKAMLAGLEEAQKRGYKGLYTIAQDNNLNACLFYLKTGFAIGGFDNRVYGGTSQADKADILFYLDTE